MKADRKLPFQTTIAGLPVTVASAEDCEKADFMICAPLIGLPMFSDNQTGACSRCSTPIQFRPYAPKRPRKLCVDCALVPLQ